MNVGKCLGVDHLESPLMDGARDAWRRWLRDDPDLAVVPELEALSAWTLEASFAAKRPVLTKLAALTESEPEAVTVLVWLLVPGAVRVADALRDLHPDIDGLVAGQLWIEAARSHELGGDHVAAAILRQTRREVCAELGVGDLARRRDRVWEESSRVEDAGDLTVHDDGYQLQDEAVEQLIQLQMDAMDAKAINAFDAWLIDQLSWTATRMGVSGRRSRMGLTAPAVAEELATMIHLSSRAIRRRAATALDRLVEYVRVRDDPEKFAVWRAQHTSCPVTPAEELQLVITDEGEAHFFRIRDLPPGANAPDVPLERRPPATA